MKKSNWNDAYFNIYARRDLSFGARLLALFLSSCNRDDLTLTDLREALGSSKTTIDVLVYELKRAKAIKIENGIIGR